MKKANDFNNNIKCECGYCNLIKNIKRYGTCKRCGKILDNKAKFEYEMVTKLKLWRYKGVKK